MFHSQDERIKGLGLASKRFKTRSQLISRIQGNATIIALSLSQHRLHITTSNYQRRKGRSHLLANYAKVGADLGLQQPEDSTAECQE